MAKSCRVPEHVEGSFQDEIAAVMSEVAGARGADEEDDVAVPMTESRERR